ncbi:MAG: hypothetical protein MUF81_11340 [Verrucomicrobia bacterium]|jgi:hypothetical protein|nr:hypothetical protein [Verrucomicrobiota bacterium]
MLMGVRRLDFKADYRPAATEKSKLFENYFQEWRPAGFCREYRRPFPDSKGNNGIKYLLTEDRPGIPGPEDQMIDELRVKPEVRASLTQGQTQQKSQETTRSGRDISPSCPRPRPAGGTTGAATRFLPRFQRGDGSANRPHLKF